MTFRVEADTDQAIITNYDQDSPDEPFQEIAASSNEIKIWDSDKDEHPVFRSIHHDTREWTTLFVEWINPKDYVKTCNYVINNDPHETGTFTFDEEGMHTTQCYIGGRSDGTHFLTGAISAFEMYSNRDLHVSIPPNLRKLIISNQMVGKETSCSSTYGMEQ